MDEKTNNISNPSPASKYPPKGLDKKDPNSWEYRKRAIQSASPLRLIIMLYEEAIHCLEESKQYMDDFKTYDIFNQRLFKAVDIIKELQISLDMKQGKIAENLNSLYDYLNTILVQAGVDKKVDLINEGIQILEDLLSSWKQIEKTPSVDLPSDSSLNSKLPRLDSGFSIKG